jgi:hypothetical protein
MIFSCYLILSLRLVLLDLLLFLMNMFRVVLLFADFLLKLLLLVSMCTFVFDLGLFKLHSAKLILFTDFTYSLLTLLA